MNLEDNIADIVTLFEVVYLPETKSELKYRLCVRCAKFLGSDSSSYHDLFTLFSIAYDIRSSIVHSGQISRGDQKKLSKLGINVNQLREKLQALLLRSLHRMALEPELRNKLDSCVLR
jgi:hypothetical protein